MKLEIYRSNWKCRGSVEYTIILNDVLIARTQMERLTTPIEDTDKVVVNMILHNLANNMEEYITRVINGNKEHYSNLICVYSSSSDKVLKELDIKLKEKELEGDF